MGKAFKGIYHLALDKIIVYDHTKKSEIDTIEIIEGLNNPAFDALIGAQDARHFREEMDLVKGASDTFSEARYLKGELTPVFFGSAMNTFGVRELLDGFI